MAKHHLIISGTGRAGTTFLMQLLTELGFDTGFADSRDGLYEHCNAGQEHALTGDLPYVLKSPHFCDDLEELLQSGGVVDHALVPIRDLYSAAQSRRDVHQRTDPLLYPKLLPGDLWGTADPDQQEAVLARKLYQLLITLTVREIPLTLLDFPRIVRDPDYLYRKIRPVLGDRGEESFWRAFQAVSRPELVHTFLPQSNEEPIGHSGQGPVCRLTS